MPTRLFNGPACQVRNWFVVVDEDGTSALTEGEAPRPAGHTDAAPLGTGTSVEEAARQTIEYVKSVMDAQNDGIQQYGIGQYYGDDSPFAGHRTKRGGWRSTTPEERAAAVKRMLKKRGYSSETELPYVPSAINCVELLFKAMIFYDERLGKSSDRIITKARDSSGVGKNWVPSGRGTVLLEQAREQNNFTTWYYNRDVHNERHDKFYKEVRRLGYGPPAGIHIRGADSGELLNVSVKIDQWAINFAPDQNSTTKKDLSKIHLINKVPFGLGVANWGEHTFVFSEGDVYEVHYEVGPVLSERKPLFEKSTFMNFAARYPKWGAGVIATAPGDW